MWKDLLLIHVVADFTHPDTARRSPFVRSPTALDLEGLTVVQEFFTQCDTGAILRIHEGLPALKTFTIDHGEFRNSRLRLTKCSASATVRL